MFAPSKGAEPNIHSDYATPKITDSQSRNRLRNTETSPLKSKTQRNCKVTFHMSVQQFELGTASTAGLYNQIHQDARLGAIPLLNLVAIVSLTTVSVIRF